MLYKMTKERVVEDEDLAFPELGKKKTKNQKRASTAARAGGGSGNGSSNGEDGERKENRNLNSQGKELEDESSSDHDSDAKELEEAGDALNGNVLMVDQLWMWAIGPSKFCFIRSGNATVEKGLSS